MVAPMGTSLSRCTRWFVVEVVKIGSWVKCGKGTTNINKNETARSEMCVMWCATCCVVNVLYSHSFWKGINYRIYSNHLFAPFRVPGQLPGSPWPVDVSMSIRSCKKIRKEKENQFQDHWKPGDSHRKSSFLKPSRWFFQGVPTKKSTTLTSESPPASINPLGIQLLWAEIFMAFNITSPHCFSGQKGGI